MNQVCCIHQLLLWVIFLDFISGDSKKKKDTYNNLKSMKKILSFIKNTVLLIAVFYLSGTIIKATLGAGKTGISSEAVFASAVFATILVAFLYSKIAKKFNL